MVADVGQPLAASIAGPRSLDPAREGGQLGHEALAIRLLGGIAAGEGYLGQADGHYRDALARAEKLGFRPLTAHCHLGHGKVYRRMGKDEQAAEHLITAMTMYHAMSMPFWLEQVEVEMRQLQSMRPADRQTDQHDGAVR